MRVKGHGSMASEYASIDLSKGKMPDLAELAEEVHRTNRPRVLRRADEEIAVIAPITRPRKQHRPVAKRGGTPYYTLEQAFGAVPIPPHLKGKSLEDISDIAKEDYVDRITRE